MSHGAAAGREGEEAAEEDVEEEEEEGISPRRSFDAWCQETPLELVRGNVSAVVGCVCSCARVRAYTSGQTGGGELHAGREVCRGVRTEIRGGDFGWAGRQGLGVEGACLSIPKPATASQETRRLSDQKYQKMTTHQVALQLQQSLRL